MSDLCDWGKPDEVDGIGTEGDVDVLPVGCAISGIVLSTISSNLQNFCLFDGFSGQAKLTGQIIQDGVSRLVGTHCWTN